MSDTIGPILQWFNAHPNMGGIVTFLISAVESIAIIGTIVPGTVTMTAIGILIGSGVLPLWSTFVWAICGAIFGDNISYWLGYYFKDRLLIMWPFKQHPQWLASGESFFNRYGGMSVVVGRFIGPIRAVVPIVAGMLKMPPWRFIFASAVASTGWAPLYMLPGILVGEATLELPPDMAVHMMMVLLLTGLVILFCIWLVIKILFLVRKQTTQVLNWIWNKLHGSKYFHGVTTLLKHHKPGNLHGQLTLAFYFAITSFLFLYLFGYVTLHNPENLKINTIFFYLFRSLHSPVRDDTMIWITMLGDKKVLLPIMFGIFVWLGYRKCWHTLIHAVGAMLLTCAGIVIFKHLAHINRPWGILHSPETFSFPSGHATFSTLFYLGLVLLFTQSTNWKSAKPLYLIMGILVGAIGFSRIYLGAHWFTDVVGGWLLSSAILMLTVLSYNRKKEKHLVPRAIFAVALAVVMVFSGLVYWHSYEKLKTAYSQVSWPIYHTTLAAWWQQQGANLPVYRIGRFGLPMEVLNLQWVGDIDQIRANLEKSGWQTPPSKDWINIVHRLTDISSTEHLPLVSPLYLNQRPILELVKYVDKKLVVLRLWNSNLTLDDVHTPKYKLWVGSLGLVPRTYSWIIHYKNDFVITSSLLFANLPQDYVSKEIKVDSPHKTGRVQTVILIKPKND